MTILRRALPLLLAALLAASAAADERYPHGRWMIGFDGLRSVIGEMEDEALISVDTEAPGGGFQFGYLLNPTLMLRVYVGGADHPTSLEDVDLTVAGGSLDLVAFLGAHDRFRPYVSGGLGGFALESQRDNLLLESEGVAFALGAGFHYHLGSLVSLHASARLEAVNWDTARATLTLGDGTVITTETPVAESGTAGKLGAGLAFWF